MNKWPILVFAAGLLLLLSGCVQPTAPAPGAQGQTIMYVCSDGKTTVADLTACPAPGTTKTLTVEEALSVCSGMPSVQQSSFEDICIIGVANKYDDSSLCLKVGRDQRMLCYVTIAELKEDPELCEEAETSTISQCYQQYATDKRDGSVCEKITDVSYRDSCYSNLAGQLSDPALCDEIANISQKDSCYFNVAMRFGDSAYCNKITNDSQKQSCLQNIQGQSK